MACLSRNYFQRRRAALEPEYCTVYEPVQAGPAGQSRGIIVANEKIITAISNMNGIISLAPGGMGPAMMCEMIKRHDLLRLSETVIKPFYYQRVQETIAIIRRYLPEDRCLIHKPEGRFSSGCGLKICRSPPNCCTSG